MQGDGVGVGLVIDDAEVLKAGVQAVLSHNVAHLHRAGLETEHVLVGCAGLLRLGLGVDGQTQQGHIILFRQRGHGQGDVGDGRAHHNADLVGCDRAGVGVDGLAHVALGVIGDHPECCAIYAAVGVDFVNSPLNAGLNHFARAGGGTGNIVQAADENFLRGGSGGGLRAGRRGRGGRRGRVGGCAPAGCQAQNQCKCCHKRRESPKPSHGDHLFISPLHLFQNLFLPQ
ncbi:hypothetical protein SDC9_119153 [bioreactor metagenome]|uniref:Uncharacterized protein n=1 Tax=bioreactor metagenome TaxID=1076179 RepID=A0A645C333_9ZZZZ